MFRVGVAAVLLILSACLSEDAKLKREFLSLMPVYVTVPSNPGQWARFEPDGTIRDAETSAQEAFGTWKIENGQLQVEVLIIYHNEDGGPCAEPGLSREACFEKFKSTVSYPMKWNGKALTIDGSSLKTDEEGRRGFVCGV